MTAEQKAFRYNLFSLLCGIEFLLTGWMWPYLMSLFIAYPFGLLGLFLWYKGRKIDKENRLGKFAIAILVIGLVVSVAAIFIYQ